MSKNMASTSATYEDASKKFEESYNKYAGEEGYKLASKQATQQAEEQSGRAGSIAGSSATQQARNSGLTKAQSALLGKDASTQAVGNTYSNIYNSEKSNALTNNSNAVNSRAGNLQTSQQEGQNRYNRSWGNVGGVGGMVSSLISDERLKCFKDVSSKLDNKTNKDEDYKLLKITYKKENK